MRKNHSKIACIKLVHLPYLYIWCTVTLISECLWVAWKLAERRLCCISYECQVYYIGT